MDITSIESSRDSDVSDFCTEGVATFYLSEYPDFLFECRYIGESVVTDDGENANGEVRGLVYLSNTHAVIPHHCLGEKVAVYALEDADIAVICAEGDRAKTLLPPGINDSNRLRNEKTWILEKTSNDLTVKTLWPISKREDKEAFYLWCVQFDDDLVLGNSGTTVTVKYPDEVSEHLKTAIAPLFVVIARHDEDNSIGLAIEFGLMTQCAVESFNFIDLRAGLIRAVQDCLENDTWQLVRGPFLDKLHQTAYRNRSDNPSFSKLTRLNHSFDDRFLAKIISETPNITETYKFEYRLWDVYMTAICVGDVEDCCWVVKDEVNSAKPARSYQLVGRKMLDLELTRASTEDTWLNISSTAELSAYSESTQNIRLERTELDKFNLPGKRKHLVCHHPLLCERNRLCKAKNCDVSIHCCIRPSHLVNLNHEFNSFCRHFSNDEPSNVEWCRLRQLGFDSNNLKKSEK